MRRVLRVLGVLLLLPIVVVGTVVGRVMLVARTAPQTFDDLRDDLGQRARALRQKDDVPGVAIALVHDGRVAWAQGYGLADKSTDMPVTESTVFQAASISKSVTAWGVMRLVEQGKVDLDAPVSIYLSRWDLPPSQFDSDQVTVRRLLSHTAGLSVHGYLGYAPDDPVPSLETELTVGSDSPPDGSVRIVYPPGEKLHYSGGGYTVLQLLVEEVSGQPFTEYMKREVLAPLGMTNSSFEPSRGLRPDAAQPYGFDGATVPLYRFAATAAAGLYTTAPDLARFVAAATTGDPDAPTPRGVLAQETRDAMQTPAPNASFELGPLVLARYGLGYTIEPVVWGSGEGLVGHGGSNRGWKTAFLGLPNQGEGVVILTNGDTGFRLVEQLKCRWVAWATGGTTPSCFIPHLKQDALTGAGIWLAVVVALILRRRRLRQPAGSR